MDRWQQLQRDIEHCTACPRLVAYRQQIARQKVRRYREWEYWGRPVPAFGDPNGWLFILGLAPAAHGANRTGRMFTGDRSGDFLYAALHRAGWANQATSEHIGDGLMLNGVLISASARCAPPDNRPSREELNNCAHFLDREIALFSGLRVVLALGQIAFQTWLAYIERKGYQLPKPKPKFRHGGVYQWTEELPPLVASYHVSQQNTQTGRLTGAMFDDILAKCEQLAGNIRMEQSDIG